MNQQEVLLLQNAQLEIMDEIHRICEKNAIHYYIIGGTALGAVRHGGFIPWDIDIDIAMKREDYDRFKEVCSDQLDSRFCYCDYINTKDFDHPHALVCMNNTVLVHRLDKFNRKKKKQSIYLDIFPLDRAPKDPCLQKKQKNKIKRIRTLKWYKVGRRNSNNFAKNFLKKLVSLLIFWTSIDGLNKSLDRTMRKYNSEDSGHLCSMASHYSYEKQCMSTEIYGVPQLVEFEGRMYYAPQKLDEYLTQIYNNYMELPPIEQRKFNLDIFEQVIFEK